MHARVSGLCDYLATDEHDALRQARQVVSHLNWRRLGPAPSGRGDPPNFDPEELLFVAPADVRFVVPATTVATNAIIEGKVAVTGFVTTEGFRDMLEIARQVRPSLYDLRFEKPRPLVPRQRCFGVPERVGIVVHRRENLASRFAPARSTRARWAIVAHGAPDAEREIRPMHQHR